MMTANLTDTFEIGSYEYERALRRRKRELRRRREMKRNLYMAVLGMILILGLSLSYHAIVSHATGHIEDVSYKYYTSVMIENGDTLWSLAQEYADGHFDSTEAYIYEVMQINHLQNEEITAGNFIILPYYDSVIK